MKHLIAIVALLFAPTQSHADEDPNYVYSVNFSQGFAVTRIAKPEHADKLRSGRTNCVLVRWVYSPKDENNIADVKPERDRVSDSVSAELNSRSEVAVAATTLGGFTGLWLLYTATGDELAKALDAKLRELPQSKYQVRVVNDADWALYQRYAEQLSEKK